MDARIARCHLLAEVLSADGIITDEERQLLERAMEDAGLAPDERDRVRHFEGAAGAAAVLRELPLEQRRATLDAMVEAALADGKLTANETATVRRIAVDLGLE